MLEQRGRAGKVPALGAGHRSRLGAPLMRVTAGAQSSCMPPAYAKLNHAGGSSRALRIRRRPEHATAAFVRPSADPHLAVWARRRLVIGNKFTPIDDPAGPGGCDLRRRFAIISAATPLAR